jgi:hypothetical protein
MTRASNHAYKRLEKTSIQLYKTVVWYQDRLRNAYILAAVSLIVGALAAYL